MHTGTGTTLTARLPAHPTRDQWRARQDTLPELARKMLAEIERKATDEQNERDMRRARQIAESAEWRAAFEAAVGEHLVSVGAEWLAAYRVPDHQCAKLPEFTGVSQWFFALFDASAAGLWPISLQMQAGTGHGRVWRPTIGARWKVGRPNGEVSFGTFEEALKWAAQYAATPF